MGVNKQKAVSGLAWSTIDNLAAQGTTFVIGIILARLLTPAEFGTLGLALVYIGLFNQIVDCGFSNALIRNNKVSNRDYNTAFFFNIGIGLFLFLVALFLSPFIAQFFCDPELEEVLCWLSVLVILNALSIIHRTILIKIIDFKTQSKISIISSVVSGIVGISAAYYGLGVMSLVFQQLVRQTINTILFWIYNHWRPKFEFDYLSFKYQFSYGIKLLFSGLIDFVFNESSSILIGKIYEPSTLGQYSRAKQYSSIFSSNLSTIIERVTLPILANFQEDKTELVDKYRVMIRSLMLFSGFLMITLACTAKSVIMITVGNKWILAISFLQIICINDMFYPIKKLNINVIQVAGRSDLVLKVTIVKRLLQVIPLALGFVNIYYMLIGLAFASVFGTILNAYYGSLCIPYSLKSQILDIIYPLALCFIPGVIMYSLSFLQVNVYALFFIQIIIGFSVMILIIKIKRPSEVSFMLDIIRSIKQRL